MMPSHLNIALFIGVGALSHPIYASGMRHEIEAHYGLIFADGSDPWTNDELRIAAGLLAELPDQLSTIARRTAMRRIKLFKVRQAPAESSHRAPLAVMHWQLFIDLDPVSDTSAKSGAHLLRRRLVHHLLHVYDSVHATSDDRRWRQLSGWTQRQYLGLRLPVLREADNQDLRGYGTEDGLDSPAADFAVFGELFFSDADHGDAVCRMHAKYEFFQRLFPTAHTRLSAIARHCPTVDDGFLDDLVFFDPVSREPFALGPINASTVEGFELLYATPGVQDAAEIAGHLLLRIKLRNNPWAARAGLENPHDLVVSFLADTDDSRTAPQPPLATRTTCDQSFLGRATERQVDAVASILQAVKGLSGGFLTVFDRQTLQQAIRTYTVDQDRNLLRYRLNLGEQEESRLLEHLYLVKKSYKTKYYFFDRNCASVLVKVIGEGLGDPEVAAFDPLVVPPNSLVALLVRKGLATPVQPAFFGYRKRAHIAQELFLEHINKNFVHADPTLAAVATAVVSKSESTRLLAYQRLRGLAEANARLRADIYRLATLAQEAEMAYMDKDASCESYDLSTVRALRDLQVWILDQDPEVHERVAIDVNSVISGRHAAQDDIDSSAGSQHTHLSSLFVGSGMEQATSTRRILMIGTALHRQDMGSISAYSMQRGTSVTLGEVNVAFDGDDSRHLHDWSVTGLKLRKFKERLDHVPAFFSPAGTLGLGLTVLDVSRRLEAEVTRGTLLGGELLANLWSSRLHNDHLYASVGLEVEERWGKDLRKERVRTTVVVPLSVVSLVTIGQDRTWQLRVEGQSRFALGLPEGRRDIARGSVVYRLAEPRRTEVLLRLDTYFEHDPMDAPDPRSRYGLGFEWNRW